VVVTSKRGASRVVSSIAQSPRSVCCSRDLATRRVGDALDALQVRPPVGLRGQVVDDRPHLLDGMLQHDARARDVMSGQQQPQTGREDDGAEHDEQDPERVVSEAVHDRRMVVARCARAPVAERQRRASPGAGCA
jgi:hypothetical protein